MMVTAGIIIPIIWAFSSVPGVFASQLYLQPEKDEHGYFTNDSFFITCITTDDSIDQLTWVGTDENEITAKSGRIYIQPAIGNQQGLQLVVQSVQKSDAGRYVCSDIQDSVSFELIVYQSISFGGTPEVQHTQEFEDAILTCRVHSDPKADVSWYHNGSKLASGDKYDVSSDSLRIFNVNRSDAGYYKCRGLVITPRGSQMKDIDISFQVQYAPEWHDDTDGVAYVSLGSLARLTCSANGNPEPTFQWLENGDIIHPDPDYTVTSNGSETNLQFIVHNKDQYGPYICRASNSQGWIERRVELKEGVVPQPPILSVVSEDKGVVKLGFKVQPPKIADLNVTGFKVQYILVRQDLTFSMLSGDSWSDAETVEFIRGERYSLKNMSYNSGYLLRAAAMNVAGYSNYSNEIRYTTRKLQVASVVADEAFRFALSSYLIMLSICFWFTAYWLHGK